MEKPEVFIVIKKGSVVNVATTKPSLTYKLIDLDEKMAIDYEADVTDLVDVKKYLENVRR